MARSKKKRNGSRRHDHGRKAEESPDSMRNEIEEQLERQRRKRPSSGVGVDREEETTPPKNLGIYQYDSNRKTYFPKEDVARPSLKDITTWPTREPNRETSRFESHALQKEINYNREKLPTASIGPTLELCGSSKRCKHLRALWTGRILTNGIIVVPNSIRQDNGWVSLLPQLRRFNPEPSPDSCNLPWDLVCKSNLYPSTQTFDVQMSADPERLPNVVSDTDGGIFVRFGPRRPRVWTERRYLGNEWNSLTFECSGSGVSGRFAPRAADDPLHLLFLNSLHSKTVTSMKFSEFGVLTRTIPPGQRGVNDVAFDPQFGRGKACVAFAPVIPKHARYATLFRDLMTDEAFHMKTDVFPKSDVLCVEFLGQNSSTALFGHRSGAISLVDKRSRSFMRVANTSEQGSVISMLVVDKQNPSSVVSKKSFGLCLLYDIRNLGSQQRRSEVWSMSPPRGNFNPTLSSCCSGLALDPTQTILVSPFIDEERAPCFALWSLLNGQCIGTKRPNSGATMITRGALPHCELNRTITPTWEMIVGKGDQVSIKRPKKRWSVWFKLATIKSIAPHCTGSIHQLSFPGDQL